MAPRLRSARAEPALDARRSPRCAADRPVRLLGRQLGGLEARSRDFGVGGLCVATASPFALASLDQVELGLPDGPLRLAVDGLWQRARPHDDAVLTGLGFRHPSESDLDRLWDASLREARDLARFLDARSELAGLGLDAALGIALASRYRELAPGRAAYRQGPAAPEEASVFVVERGEIQLQIRRRPGREERVGCLGRGGVFGGGALLGEHGESALAATPTRLLEIDADGWQHLCDSRPRLARRLEAALHAAAAERLAELLARSSDRP